MSALKSVDLDEIAAMNSRDVIPLDRHDRYLIVPADSEDNEAVPHTRATTVAKTLDDGYGVADWTRRLTVLGFAQNQRLYARLCALDPDDKHAINTLCEEAKKVAGGEDAKDDGNILHSFAERTAKGEKLHIPEPYKTDIDAFHRRLDELEIRIVPEYVERYVVNTRLPEPVAGKTDNFGVHFGSTLKVADLKTGRIGPWSWLAFATQLAIYSRSDAFYEQKTKTHIPTPAVDQDTGLIFHLPAGAATCSVYFVDLNFGWEMAQLACVVRAARKKAKSGEIAEEWTPGGVVHQLDVRRARLVERIAALKEIPGGTQMLLSVWPTGVAGFRQSSSHTADELDLIAMAVSTAENKLQAPFRAADPADH